MSFKSNGLQMNSLNLIEFWIIKHLIKMKNDSL